MFHNCENLESFTSDLSSLTDGSNMFHNCKLDAPSIKNIALTINRNVTNNPRIDLGIGTAICSEAQVKKDLGLIKSKGWTMYDTNSYEITDYTNPKYKDCTDTAQIKSKDNDYLEDIVNGSWTEHLPDLLNGTEMF
jgi:hypothetical protein